MDATLTTSDDAYHLDWNGNSLTDKPILAINGETSKQWPLIDILLDIFRHLPQKPSVIYVPPSSNAKEKVLKMFHSWGADTPHRKDHSFVYLDGHLLAIETHNTSDLKMGACRVININYER